MDARELRKGEARIRLAEKPFLVLVALLEHAGEVVTREELRRRLWAEDTFVDFDNNLNSAVATLRDVLGDSARTPRFIETVPRRGYRFVGNLESAQPVSADTGNARVPRTFHVRRWSALGTAMGLLAATVWLATGQWIHPTPATNTFPTSANQDFIDGLYLLERDDPASLERAASLLARAAEEEPGNAAAHAALGETWMKLTLYGRTPKDTGLSHADSALNRALQLDARLPAAHRGLALMKLYRDWNPASASFEIERAIAEDPGDPKSHLIAALVSAASGRPGDSVAAARRAMQLDPANWRVRSDLAYFLLSAGHFEEAFAESQAVLALEPEFGPALDFLLASGEHLGKYDVARAASVKLMRRARASQADIQAVEEAPARQGVHRYRRWQIRMMERRGGTEWPAMTAASVYASAGRADEAFSWLRRAYDRRDMHLVFLGASPDFLLLRSDPRYTEMLRRVGLPASPPPS